MPRTPRATAFTDAPFSLRQLRLLPGLADNDEGRPQPWISLIVGFSIIDDCEHCLTQRFGVGQMCVMGARLESVEHQPRCGFIVHLPVRHDQRSGAGIEERPRKTRQRLGPRFLLCGGIACRQNHPVGIELELCDFACLQQAIVKISRLFGMVSTKAGSALLLANRSNSPETSPWVAK